MIKIEPDVGACNDEADCSNNGKCENNQCICNLGFDGEKDCSST